MVVRAGAGAMVPGYGGSEAVVEASQGAVARGVAVGMEEAAMVVAAWEAVAMVAEARGEAAMVAEAKEAVVREAEAQLAARDSRQSSRGHES